MIAKANHWDGTGRIAPLPRMLAVLSRTLGALDGASPSIWGIQYGGGLSLMNVIVELLVSWRTRMVFRPANDGRFDIDTHWLGICHADRCDECLVSQAPTARACGCMILHAFKARHERAAPHICKVCFCVTGMGGEVSRHTHAV